MEISRNKQHFIAMTVIYNELVDFNMAKGEVSRNAVSLMKELCEVESDNDIPHFVAETVRISLSKYGEIVNAVEPNLKDWKWSRLPLITQAILLMSFAHYKYVEKVDKSIVINVAVNLAKTYIEEKQAKFINAILDKTL